MNIEAVYQCFYRIPRMAAQELSDCGGPFGFDITAALEADWLIERYGCDAIIETGCNVGDTTAYFSRRYPGLPIITCDIKPKYAAATRQRLATRNNVIVEEADSPQLIECYAREFRCPYFYLDAHWYKEWPLERELTAIHAGIIAIDDFDIGNARFGFDEYDGLRCGPDMLAHFRDKFPCYYTNNPDAIYEFPCLQVARRGGRAYLPLNQPHDYPRYCNYFVRHALHETADDSQR